MRPTAGVAGRSLNESQASSSVSSVSSVVTLFLCDLRELCIDRLDSYATARSVISSPRSMIANASRISASVMHSGGFVKNVFQRTNV